MNKMILFKELANLYSYFTSTKKSILSQRGGDQCTDINSSYSNYPDCFEICLTASKIFDKLQVINKCGNSEYHDLAKLYSNLFCFEMALGNNNLQNVEDQKVEKELERIIKKYNMDELKSLEKFFIDMLKMTKDLLTDIGSDKELLTMNEEIFENHSKNIIKLYRVFRKLDKE